MKRKLRGIKRADIKLDFDLYRVSVPVPAVADAELSVVDMRPEGVEQTIVFVHGFAGCLETWEYQINHFARTYRVVAPDLRGHGQSDAPLTRYTMDELVADLDAVIDRLDLPETFILAGHSFGGSVCIEYAVAHPERLEKLILIATAGEFPLPRLVSLASRIPTVFLRPLWKYRPRWNAEIHTIKRMLVNNMMKWKGWSMMRDITTPTLVITGQQDTYFPRFAYEDVGKMIPGAEVYDVGAVKHKVQLERHATVNRAMERFMAGNQRASWRDLSETGHLLPDRPWLGSYGKETPPTVPIPHRPLHYFLTSAADWVPRHTAIIFYGSKLSYQQLNSQVNQLANIFLGQGVQPGDRVMIILPNIPQFVVAYYATLKIGAVAVLPNPDADAEQILAQLQQTRPQAVVTLDDFDIGYVVENMEPGFKPRALIVADIRSAVSNITYSRLLMRWGQLNLRRDDRPRFQGGLSLSELMRDAPDTEPDIDVDIQALATIIFTSGTTNMPKGVCLTHANLVANAIQTRHWIPDLDYGGEVFLSVIPLMHSYGLTNAMNIPILLGASIVLLPVFELQTVLNQIKLYRPTIFPGVPSMYAAINQASNVRSYGLSSIKACISGSAPLPVEVQEAFEKLSRGRLVEGYGLTEASPVTHANPLYGVRKSGSIGVPIPNTAARIVDLVTGEDLPPGQVGELVVKGPQVMQGYWQGEGVPPAFDDEDEQVLQDGWLYTGDVAVMDNEGYFKIISRKRDTIMTGEYSVYPRDVEEVLYENHKVLEVAVVGVSTVDQQRVKAFVVPRPGTQLSKEELLDLCRRRLEPYAVPWEIEFRERLPKSFIGKVLRRMLVEEKSRLPKPGTSTLNRAAGGSE